jgi:hypothetical protein
VDRPYLDANVLYSAARSPTSRLHQLWTLPETDLLTSAYAIEEARRNLVLDKPDAVPGLDTLVAAMTVVAEPAEGVALPAGMDLPAKDVPVFLAAVQAGATHFLTGDKKHFGPYAGTAPGGVVVLPPGEYLDCRLPPGDP